MLFGGAVVHLFSSPQRIPRSDHTHHIHNASLLDKRVACLQSSALTNNAARTFLHVGLFGGLGHIRIHISVESRSRSGLAKMCIRSASTDDRKHFLK